MKIMTVEPFVVEVPMRAPIKGVHGETSVQRSALVRVVTDAHVEGWGNVDPTPGYSLWSRSSSRPRPPSRWRSAISKGAPSDFPCTRCWAAR